MEAELHPLREADLEFVCEVRNHPQTLACLHNDRAFSLAEVRDWFAREDPEWYVIVADGVRRGYVRTSEKDERNRSLKIGADIHPDYRRAGYAEAAYQQLIARLQREGWHRLWLEVLTDNEPAIRLYEKLGFRREGCKIEAVKRGEFWRDSFLMSLIDKRKGSRNLKVIVTYFGNRRKRPANAQAAYDMLGFLLEKEGSVDPGCSADTLIVHNRIAVPNADFKSAYWMGRCEELLAQADGTAGRAGTIRVIERENIGISFGGFNHSFVAYGDQYDYWLFTEDDQLMVRDGYFGQAIRQMQDDQTIGFVAIVGVSRSRRHPRHAHGGVGVSSRKVLQEVMAANRCRRHPGGHLPFHNRRDYDRQEVLGEIRFTNAIDRIGYRLVNLAMEDVCVSWGEERKRTPRMVPWNESLVLSCRR